jgi:hypothetical protein
MFYAILLNDEVSAEAQNETGIFTPVSGNKKLRSEKGGRSA